MRRRFVVAAVAVLLLIGAGIAVWLQQPGDPSRIRAGDAFGSTDGSYEIGVPTARANDDLWYFAPAVTNQSSEKLTLEDVQPGTLPEGLEFVGARLFDKDVFLAGVPMSWNTSGGAVGDDPSTKPSTGVQGYPLLPGQTLPNDKIVYLHLRVTTSSRPLKSDGVKFVYRQNGKLYSQTLNANLTIPSPTPHQ